MKVKLIKTKKEFKPFTIELTFEDEKEVLDLYSTLSATALSWDSTEMPFYGDLGGLRDMLMKELGIVQY